MCRPHDPQSQIREMCGTAEEVGHHVVGGMAVWECGVVCPQLLTLNGSPHLERLEAKRWRPQCSSCHDWWRPGGGNIPLGQTPPTRPNDRGDCPVSGAQQPPMVAGECRTHSHTSLGMITCPIFQRMLTEDCWRACRPKMSVRWVRYLHHRALTSCPLIKPPLLHLS